jgi:putative ABC transport system ATP-binding protein
MAAHGGVDISVRDLCHVYATSDGPVPVLDDVSFAIPAATFVAITGASGAGKTTLLSLLGGLDRIQRGSVRVGDTDLGTLRGDQLAEYRRSTVGFVFQDFGLLGAMTAQENVELALTFAGMGVRARARRAAELLDAVGLAARRKHRPAALSGGEAQRVAIARALANDPALVLADEPTGNLDEDSTETVLAMLSALPVERGCTVVVVTHNSHVAARADVRFALQSRALVQVGAS